MKQICLKNKFLCTVNNLTKGDLKMCDYEKTEYDAPCGSRVALAGQQSPDRTRPKYYDILEAIEHLVDARRGVQELCDQIVGVDGQKVKPDDAKISKKKPSLLDILDNMPIKISQEVDMIHRAVNEIRLQIL